MMEKLQESTKWTLQSMLSGMNLLPVVLALNLFFFLAAVKGTAQHDSDWDFLVVVAQGA